VVELINCDVEAFWLGGTEVNGTITNEDDEAGFAQWDKYFNYENPEPNDTQGLAEREPKISTIYGYLQLIVDRLFLNRLFSNSR